MDGGKLEIFILYNDATVSSEYIASNVRNTNQSKMIRNGTIEAYFRVFSRNFPLGTEEIRDKPQDCQSPGRDLNP